MSSAVGSLGPGGRIPHSRRLARLILVPGPQTPAERLEQVLGPELARFLVSALTADGQGRVGSSSP
jgi:hypothetical protein